MILHPGCSADARGGGAQQELMESSTIAAAAPSVGSSLNQAPKSFKKIKYIYKMARVGV